MNDLGSSDNLLKTASKQTGVLYTLVLGVLVLGLFVFSGTFAGKPGGGGSTGSGPTLKTPADASTITTTTPQFTWGRVGGAKSYRIQVTKGTDTAFATPEVNATSTSTDYKSGVLNGGAHRWRVRTENGSTLGSWSTEFTFTSPTPADTIVPTAPSALMGTPTDTKITLSWTASTDNVGVASYDVYRNSVLVGNSPTNGYVDSGLTPVTSYTYFVKAKDAAGNTSAASSTKTVTTTETIPTVSITSPATGTVLSGTVTVSGTASSGSGNSSITKVEVAGSYGNYQVATGTTNWSATLNTAAIKDGTNRYVFARATNSLGTFNVAWVKVTIKNDSILPTVAISSPANNSTQTGFFTATGTASDSAGIDRVVVNGEVASGTSNWSILLTSHSQSNLYKGKINAQVFDVNGNSATVTNNYTASNGSQTGTIQGEAFQDINNNGIRDSGEAPFADHALYLYSKGTTTDRGEYSGLARTDATGKYSFNMLANGNYYLEYSTSSWWGIDDGWVPTTLSGSLSPRTNISLNGSATINFGWRPITFSTDKTAPLTSYTGDNGMKTESYVDTLSAQDIYSYIAAGKLIGDETTVTRYKLAEPGTSSVTGASYATTNGRCTGSGASANATWNSWLGDEIDEMGFGRNVAFHEYGHVWQNYWACLHQDVKMYEFLRLRGLYGDSRLGTSHAWSVREINAEDYKFFFSSSQPQESIENSNIPLPDETPGLKDYLITTFRTAR